MVCDTCGLACRLPTSDSLALFESGYALYAHAPGESREQTRQAEYARWIARVIGTPPSRVLDVGCGNGSLLRALRQFWPDADLLGCDPSGEAIAAGSGEGVRLWRGTALDLPRDLGVDLVLTVNVIEHTIDPLPFVDALAGAVVRDGRVIVICPDGGRPGLELLFVDHLFSFARPHLEAMMRRGGLNVIGGSRAPESLGAFQMVVGRRSDERGPHDVEAAHIAGRSAYLERWRALDAHLVTRLGPTAVCFGAGEAAGLLRAYAPQSWARVVACTADGVSSGHFGGVPIVPLDHVDADVSLLLGVRPRDQKRLAERLRAGFSRVIEWYDLVDDEHG
jgi:SAM-dependent methyltransferase